MKIASTATLILTLALSAEAAGTSEKKLARAETQIAKGNAIVASAQDVKGDAKRLRVLRGAKRYFIWARTGAQNALKKADGDLAADLRKAESRARRALVDVLIREAGYYHTRGSTSLARRRTVEALKLMPRDRRALDLAAELKKPRKTTQSDRRVARKTLAAIRYDDRRGTLINPHLPRGATTPTHVMTPARAAGASKR